MTKKVKTHQITLLGGQVLPVYWGIKEKSPDVVHVLYTKESRNSVAVIINQFKSISFKSYQVDPYDYTGIRELAEKIVYENVDDNYQLNLTSGTKVMALACQKVFESLSSDFNVFYIDQKHRLFNLNSESYEGLTGSITTNSLFALSGHRGVSSHKLSKYSKDEVQLANQVLELTNNNSGLNKLFQNVRKNCKDTSNTAAFNFKNSKQSVSWKGGVLKLTLPNHSVVSNSKNAFHIVFGGLWWEILIADATKSWSQAKEQLMGVTIPTKLNQNQAKNEIDILLNTGRNFIFIECKAGNVNQGDINKIRTVNRMYGGVSSKSILICRYIPRPDILEKCKDLGIDVFSYQTSFRKNKKGQFTSLNSLKDINKKLDHLINRLEV